VPLILLATFAPQPVLVAGLCAAGMVAVNVLLDAGQVRRGTPGSGAPGR
jgi:hypothetical protein